MREFEKQADNIAVVIEEGEICDNNTYRIMECSNVLILKISDMFVEESDSIMVPRMIIQSLQYYETIRK